MSTLSINCVTFEASLYIVDQLISKKSLIEIDRFFACVVYEQRANIKAIKSKSELDIMVLRNINSKGVEKYYQSLGKVDLKQRQSGMEEEVALSPTRLKNSPSPPASEINKKFSPSPPASEVRMFNRPTSISIKESTPPVEEEDVRRTVSTVVEEQLRSRVSEMETMIKNMKKQETQKSSISISDFKKKQSGLDPDPM